MEARDILLYVNGNLLPRNKAVVSVYDAGFLSGDGIFEGLRIYNNKIFKLSEHIKRLLENAGVLEIRHNYDFDGIREAIRTVIEANHDLGVNYLRLQMSRGTTKSPTMDPAESASSPTLVIYPEIKEPIYNKQGIKLMTSHIRRIPPDSLDQKIHTFNKLNSILAKLESNRYGMDDAIMLDKEGFVAETSTANIFFVKGNVISTSLPHACLNGITRQTILAEAPKLGYKVLEKNHSIFDIYTSDEIFLTGTVGEIAPVVEVDGRKIGNGGIGKITKRISEMYMKVVNEQGETP
jgi:branched-chain amino acid aminotransferase